MIDLFYQGGVLFMSLLTLLFLSLLFSVWKQKAWIKEIGRLALAIGILGQIIGLYSAFQSIEEISSVNQQVMASGIRISSITTIYGLVIFIVSIVLDLIVNRAPLSAEN